MSRWEACHCIVCVTVSTFMVRLEVVTVWAPLSSCIVLPPCLTLNRLRDRSLELSSPCRSRWHVACCWFRQAFVLLHWLFQLAIHGSACLVLWQQSLVVGLELNWTFFPQSLTCLSSARLHTCWIVCSAWPIHDLPLCQSTPLCFFGVIVEWIFGILHHN